MNIKVTGIIPSFISRKFGAEFLELDFHDLLLQKFESKEIFFNENIQILF
jgi:hypothetical protein